jgi:hypothetical protein
MVDGSRTLPPGNGARAVAEELKKRFPMLPIMIWDAQTKTNVCEEIQASNPWVFFSVCASGKGRTGLS